jgi:alpha-tubulin suppressor-like RCC1 family protein
MMKSLMLVTLMLLSSCLKKDDPKLSSLSNQVPGFINADPPIGTRGLTTDGARLRDGAVYGNGQSTNFCADINGLGGREFKVRLTYNQIPYGDPSPVKDGDRACVGNNIDIWFFLSNPAQEETHYLRLELVSEKDGSVADVAQWEVKVYPNNINPYISQVSPRVVRTDGKDRIAIFGTNFLPGAWVDVNGFNCDEVMYYEGMITCRMPAMAAGTFFIDIENPGGEMDTLSNAIEVKNFGLYEAQVGEPFTISDDNLGHFNSFVPYSSGCSTNGLNITCNQQGTEVVFGTNNYGVVVAYPIIAWDMLEVDNLYLGSGVTCVGKDSVRCFGLSEFWSVSSNYRTIIGDEENDLPANMPDINVGNGVVTDIDISSTFACAVLDNTRVKCWGRNDVGQVGQGNGFPYYGASAGLMGDDVADVDLDTSKTIAEIDLGSRHACVRYTDGSVKCWGVNNQGHLGLGDANGRGDTNVEMGMNLPFMQTDGTVLDIATGYNHTCIINEIPEVKCFGSNSYGQLGVSDDAVTNLGTAIVPDAILAINLPADGARVAAGVKHSCALMNGNIIKCWGEGSQGALGTGNQNDYGKNATFPIAAGPNVDTGPTSYPVSIAVHQDISCARYANGAAKCWGTNLKGQLGLGNNSGNFAAMGDQANEMGNNLPFLDLPRNVLDIQPGANHVCALLDDNRVYCWGSNEDGALGILTSEANPYIGDDPGEMGNNLRPVDLGNRPVSKIAVGYSQTCAVFTNGGAKCWGKNQYGQTGYKHSYGDAPGETYEKNRAINLGMKPIQMSIGSEHACAVDDLGNVKCWGSYQFARLGHGSGGANLVGLEPKTMGTNLPVTDLGPGWKAEKVVAGYAHSCAMNSEGVKCWGDADNGAVGAGAGYIGDNDAEMGNNRPLVSLGVGVKPLDIVSGYFHVCIITEGGDVKCWGGNTHGQLGYDDIAHRGQNGNGMGGGLANVDLNGDKVVQLVAGASHTCALTENQTVKCWGQNNFGQLGAGISNNIGDDGIYDMAYLNANEVDFGVGTPTQIAAGNYFTCILINTGEVKCFGVNDLGQLGIGTQSNVGQDAAHMGANLQPVIGLGMKPIQKLVAGGEQACVIYEDNTTRCWGFGMYGQLAKGTPDIMGDNPTDFDGVKFAPLLKQY